MWQFSRLPTDKTKSLFDDVQRKSLGRFFDQIRSLEPALKQTGQWPADDDDADKTDAQPVNPKK